MNPQHATTALVGVAGVGLGPQAADVLTWLFALVHVQIPDHTVMAMVSLAGAALFFLFKKKLSPTGATNVAPSLMVQPKQ